jgi:hypothetical protein
VHRKNAQLPSRAGFQGILSVHIGAATPVFGNTCGLNQSRAVDPSGMPRPAILNGTSNHARLFVQVTAIAILLAPHLGILAGSVYVGPDYRGVAALAIFLIYCSRLVRCVTNLSSHFLFNGIVVVLKFQPHTVLCFCWIFKPHKTNPSILQTPPCSILPHLPPVERMPSRNAEEMMPGHVPHLHN